MTKTFLIAASAMLVLAGCNDTQPRQQATDSTPPETPSRAAPSAPPQPAFTDAPGPAESPSPQANTPLPAGQSGPAPVAGSPPLSEKGEAGARAVIDTWARSLEKANFGRAWEQFADPPSTRADYARWWSRYRTIAVTVAPGSMDAGAGSLYYSAHTTITGLDRAGKPYRLEGNVLLRRVNDVDGASPAQLRWHLSSAILEDAPK